MQNLLCIPRKKGKEEK